MSKGVKDIISVHRPGTDPSFSSEHFLLFSPEICLVFRNQNCFPVNHVGCFDIPIRSMCKDDFQRGRFFRELENSAVLASDYTLTKVSYYAHFKFMLDNYKESKHTVEIILDPYLISFVVHTLCHSSGFRRSFGLFLRSYFPNFSQLEGELHIRMVIYSGYSERFDHAWEDRVFTLAMRNELIREHLAWLNTLGGAFSALGKIGFRAFALRAGKISVSQWRLAQQLADPILMARSRIFFAISLIQQRAFRMAKKILRRELLICRQEVLSSESEKLESIIKSVWDYMVYEQNARKNGILEERVLEERATKLLFREETIRAKSSLADIILSMSSVKLDSHLA